MTRKDLLQRIKDVQEGNKSVTKLKDLCDVVEAGKTGFIPRKTKESGYVLFNIVEVKPRERKIQIDNAAKQLGVDDFLGVHPFLGYVMESSSDQFKPKDIILLDPDKMNVALDVVVRGAKAIYIPDYCIIGIDKSIEL